MSLISVKNLTFAYDGSYDNVFENVSFNISTDWKLGFTGRNGRGKTTFLNLLLGKYDCGESITSDVSFEYFPYRISDMSLSAIDAAEELCPGSELWELIRELTLLGVTEEAASRPLYTLSEGERTKALLAALFLRENSFPLIDEPTNHLDMSARRSLSRYLSAKKGFILVSHDRVFLDNCVDHILSINKTNIEIQQGNFSSWLLNKQRADSFEQTESDKLKKDIKRLKQSAKRTGEWSERVEKSKSKPLSSGLSADRGYIGHKSAKMMKRSKAIEARQLAAADEKERLLQNAESAEGLKLTQPVFHASRLVSLEHVTILYGDKAACADLSFNIERGDRIALTGVNGSGKSSVLKLICGEDITHTGQFHRERQLAISYVPQDASQLSGDLSEFARKRGIDESVFKAILRKLDFSRIQFEKDMRDYSDGQKKKVLLAASLCESAHLHVWDEPLNFIDVISRMQIEELLTRYKPTMLFVEHDAAFCDNIATKTVAL